VGDSQRTDITGGQTAGMWTVHFLGANDSDAAVSTADARIRRFAELPVVLDSLAGSLRLPPCPATPRVRSRRTGKQGLHTTNVGKAPIAPSHAWKTKRICG
jgi:hypothetical protein